MNSKIGTISEKKHNQIRSFDINRDLNPVADLIESCFSSTLDADGRRYLRRMRAAANQKGLKLWSVSPNRSKIFSLSGFVWEESGEVVGNLSLVPFSYKGKRVFLIANVAVKSEYRRRGIAQALTSAALEKCRKRKVDEIWLQVRSDNQAAIDLYLKRGFVPKARRTTWVGSPGELKGESPKGLHVTRRRLKHWSYHRTLLDRGYPEILRWHYKNDIRRIIPGFENLLLGLLDGSIIHHWVVYKRKEILGIISWQRVYRFTDRLWLATLPEFADDVVNAVLPRFQHDHRMNRQFSLDCPEGLATNALYRQGFEPKSTLIWMQISPD
jgi:predicted N-acetyltransferase YhbS